MQMGVVRHLQQETDKLTKDLDHKNNALAEAVSLR
jgi:hypothetical protein